jgi:hypothetical protein
MKDGRHSDLRYEPCIHSYFVIRPSSFERHGIPGVTGDLLHS